MPKRVDHDQRREEIVRALWQVVMSDGIPAATLRRVAAEAGVSMNLVQYYVTTKDQLLRYGLQRIIETAVARMQAELSDKKGPRARLRACLLGMVPVDETTRLTSTIYIAYMSYAVHDPDIKAMINTIPRSLATQLAPALKHTSHPLQEAESLVMLVAGLTDQILLEAYTADEAIALVDYHLDRLFP